ncbi:hypothetical protein BBM45_04910 [Vibrio parahaemolyticus]|uniref:hypothetical protein n=1 Tax=Vibrio parahaemolyticus TaxID=670 RepID=UPI00084A975E|nr:hypothetical protein [Vibrio parahaemolyticus]ODZ79300.1 hypothetical protein BBM45_04910 [Vibrio parahaemolyticus]
MKEIKKLFVMFFLVAILLIVIAVSFYVFNVGGGFSSVSEAWGDFGSYIGGVVSSIFGSLSLCVIGVSLYLQLKESRSNAFYSARDKCIEQIDIYIARQREMFTFEEMMCECRIREIQATYIEHADEESKEQQAIRERKINSEYLDLADKHVTITEEVDELLLLKTKLFGLQVEDTKEMYKVFYSGFSNIFSKNKELN